LRPDHRAPSITLAGIASPDIRRAAGRSRAGWRTSEASTRSTPAGWWSSAGRPAGRRPAFPSSSVCRGRRWARSIDGSATSMSPTSAQLRATREPERAFYSWSVATAATRPASLHRRLPGEITEVTLQVPHISVQRVSCSSSGSGGTRRPGNTPMRSNRTNCSAPRRSFWSCCQVALHPDSNTTSHRSPAAVTPVPVSASAASLVTSGRGPL